MLAALALLLAACGADDVGGVDADDQAVSSTTSPSTSTSTTSPSDSPFQQEEAEKVEEGADRSEDPAPTDPTPEPADPPSRIDLAVNDLARRLDVERQVVTVISEEDVVWRDGSLGCPEPGMSYTQALVTNGFLIKLRVDGDIHEYHGAGDTPPFYCENPTEPYKGEPGDA